MSKDNDLSESYVTSKFWQGSRKFITSSRAKVLLYTKTQETGPRQRVHYVLLCRTEACWKLLSSYLHVESRHNETHVLTVDAAPGADLLSWTRFPERKSEMKREREEGRERRNTRANGQRGPLCAKLPLESATSDLEDRIRIAIASMILDFPDRADKASRNTVTLDAKLEFKDR